MAISNWFIELVTPDGEIQRQMLDGSGRILDADGVTKRVRQLLLQNSRRVSDVTSLLSENIAASYLPDWKVIDKHTWSIPDLIFSIGGTTGFCEVKTAARGNYMVFKREQTLGFLDIPDCYIAFTEHNLQQVRLMVDSRGGKKRMLDEFRLNRAVILSVADAWKMYEWLTASENLNSSRGLVYKNVRMSQIHRFVAEKKWKIRTSEEISTVLVGKAREIELVLNQPPAIMTVGRARRKA